MAASLAFSSATASGTVHSVRIVEITAGGGCEWLARAEAVHRHLRPLRPDDCVGKIKRIMGGGARVALAVEGGAVLGAVSVLS